MAYDEFLAERIERALNERHIRYSDKKMFGGIAFMVDDKMCLGVVRNALMARVGPEAYDRFLEKRGARPMDFTGRPMKGYIFVEPEGVDAEDDLGDWVEACLAYNPLAKSSKKK